MAFKGERLMEVVLIPPAEASSEKAKPLKKLKFKKGRTVNVDAKGALPKEWDLRGEFNLLVLKRKGKFRAEVPGMPAVYGGEYTATPKEAVKDLMGIAVETRTDLEGDGLQDLGPAIIGTAVDLRTKLQPSNKSPKA